MKKAEIFIIFTVILGWISIAIREDRYGDEHQPFVYWFLAGLIIGSMCSVTLIRVYYPRASDGRFESRKTSPGLFFISFTAMMVLSFLGMSLVNLSVQMKKATDAVQNWPSIQATVEGQKVYERPPGKTGPRWWAPTWSYFYELSGKTLHSHSTSAENAYALIPKLHVEEAEADLQQRPVGSRVTAFYDPTNPELSVLDKRSDIPLTRYMILAVGIFILVSSGAGTFILARKLKSRDFQ